MANDLRGNEINVGDIVNVPCVVVEVCNDTHIQIKFEEPLHAFLDPSNVVLASQQVEKI